ncbi:MAG: DUF4886 domain-containing protein [Clostridia bacterium]|nr:DUF4886 domain-containing protein [Clostridia bacterium]
MKILSIGNSFSCDAQRYLHEIAKARGDDMQTVNLDIGGCSLQTHCENLISDEPLYELEINGKSTGRLVSISCALQMDDWDVVTLQQASHFSADFNTYSPYMSVIATLVRKVLPKARVVIHQTWAYEDGSERLLVMAGFQTSKEMFEKVERSYLMAREEINADGIIPCGRAMYIATTEGLKVHRDTFHASLGLGRYLLGLTWYGFLTGKDVSIDEFGDFDEPVSKEERKKVIKAVTLALRK